MTTTLPPHLRSPTTFPTPRQVAPGPNGEPLRPPIEVVQCDGRLWNLVQAYIPHEYATPDFADVGPFFAEFLGRQWAGHNTDERAENQEHRTAIEVFAAEIRARCTSPSPRLDLRRAWRVIDWKIRIAIPTLLDLAGFRGHAERFRSMEPVTGPSLPPESKRVIRAAHRELDQASTRSVRGQRPYAKRKPGESFLRDAPDLPIVNVLYRTAEEAFPSIARQVEETYHSKETVVRWALNVGSFAKLCVNGDRRIQQAALDEGQKQLQEAEQALLQELIAMGASAQQKRAA